MVLIFPSVFFSLYTLIFALFGKTSDMSTELFQMQKMAEKGANYGLDLGTSTEAPETKDCFVIPVPCPVLSRCSNIFSSIPSME